MKSRLACGALVAALVSVATPAQAVDTFSRETIRPLLLSDVNALIANHYFIQSMLAFDSTPLTAGISVNQARANYLRSDGVVFKGALSRTALVLSAGLGRPATDLAFFGVLNLNGVGAASYPNIPFRSDGSDHIQANTFGILGALGVAYKGWVAQFGLFWRGYDLTSDGLGRLSSCPQDEYCSATSTQRPGAPTAVQLIHEEKRLTNKMVTLENASGYSLSALFGSFEDLAADGTRRTKTELASLRALAQPNNLLPRALGLLGVGITTFAPDIDYYGDRAKAARDALARGQQVPPADKGIVEFPIVGDRLANTGAIARVVLQGYPSPNFRLAEVGYVFEGDETASFLPQAGARAKVFRRDTSITASADLYAGFFWVFSQSNRLHEGRGVSTYVTYSYNTPDSSNFVPISDAHVIGVQLVFGNPAAMPPPVNAVKYPATARRTDDVKLTDDEKKQKKALDQLDLGP